MARPRVLFVCVRNGGKSQMAAGLMRHHAGDRVDVDSAGTDPGARINALSAQSLLEVGADITAERPRAVTDELVAQADLVVVLGREATLSPADGTSVITWATEEPSERGIEGIERMRLIRDDIDARVRALATELAAGPVGTD